MLFRWNQNFNLFQNKQGNERMKENGIKRKRM